MRSSLYSNSLLSPFLSQAKERDEEKEKKKRRRNLRENATQQRQYKTRTTFFRARVFMRARDRKISPLVLF
tara:strand:+ start:132 stop:344 length:213 start_codon:yes stop_codon:yes gene_type:complete